VKIALTPDVRWRWDCHHTGSERLGTRRRDVLNLRAMALASKMAKEAGRFHRNGQLRFLFERAQVPDQEPTTLLASLYSVKASADDHVAVDDEGGTRTKGETPTADRQAPIRCGGI
jgi:hypothetical protein